MEGGVARVISEAAREEEMRREGVAALAGDPGAVPLNVIRHQWDIRFTYQLLRYFFAI